MIPRRVTLRGFLSYRDEQSLDFTDAPLWMLAGPNGSGKSAVFDAVTYALFGAHRSGSQNADELISKDSDGFAVEFEFSLGESLFQARRTLKRNSRGRPAATQQLLHFDRGRQQWQPVAETSKKKQFDAWISDNIGLRYETFTTSVLLLQGQAERLLSQTPADRFKVLADIVDLERYVRLHARVDEARKKFKATGELLRNQLAGVPEIPPAEFDAAKNRRMEAEGQCKRIAEVLDRLRTTEVAAHRWAALQQRNRDLQNRRARADKLLAYAPAIECDLRRLQELRAIIPRAEKAMSARRGLEASRRAIDEWDAQLRQITEQVAGIGTTIDQTRRKRDALNQELERNEGTRAKLTEEMPGLAAAVARLDLLQTQQRELLRAEEKLQSLPTDLAQRLAMAMGAVDELNALERALPMLTRLQEARRDLVARLQDSTDTAWRLQSVMAGGEQLKSELARLEPLLFERSISVERAQEATTASRTLGRQAETQLESFRNLDDAKLCSLCGQPLTPEHREHELQKRTEEVAAASRKIRESEIALSKAIAERDALAGQIVAQKKDRDAKRDEYRDLKQSCEHIQRETERLKRTLGESFIELPEPIRSLVAAQQPDDWAVTTYPTADDLNRGRIRVAELPAARQRLQSLQSQQKSTDELRGGVESLRRSVGQLAAGAPGDPGEIRRRQARNEADLTALIGRIGACRTEVKAVQNDLDRLGREHTDLQQRAADLSGRLRAERAKLELTEQALAAAYADLPDAWRPLVERAGLGDQQRWKRELDDLTASDIEQKAADLPTARASLQALAEEESTVAAAIAGVPEDARREFADVEAETQEARRTASSAESAFRSAHDEVMRLESFNRQRDALSQQLRATERDHQLHVQLAELLGRERLQRHLVRRAERQIVDHASAILDRLSGGELHLRLRTADADSESAFDLEVVNRAASAEPIGVAFLSGSQRFRVAVSLALGVGRYASGEQRPIESVIIDEGFGCLDRNGRQVMIQELQNLRGFLKRILLVSHQEEFADAFSDGYRFELSDGSTRVTRIQR
jgi:DNA repair protein SbcC/Rad50